MTEGYRTPAGPLRAIVEMLVGGGVRDVVICPGSRSTPMALALKASPDIRCWVHLDERAGAYFALGAAKGGRRPAAILATSGTAVVNFAPAVAEARYGRVPLILLTADRPPELQGVGAPQTIDQFELYGRHAKWFAELPVPDDASETEVEVRSTVARALAVATTAPAGPVQLNLPFREPLLPTGSLMAVDGVALRPGTASQRPLVPAELLERALPRLRSATRPLIVCGPLDRAGFATAVTDLAEALGAPVLADVLANVCPGSHAAELVIGHHDVLLRTRGASAGLAPDLVLRFGATPTSKALNVALDAWTAPQLLIDDGVGWNLPAADTIERVDADPVAFAEAAGEALRAATGDGQAAPGERTWLARWHDAGTVAAEALEGWQATLSEPFEGAVARAVDQALPDDAVVLLGNSMPVRDFDTFLLRSDRRRRYLGNRGVNGIDGLIATALGLRASQPHPVVLVLGDLSFLHDLTSLLAAQRLGLDLTIVLIDNDGGGIFSFLPQASAQRPDLGLPEHYETLFGTPHGLDLRPISTALGATHRRVGGGDLARGLRACVGRPGVTVMEVDTDRARNVALHREALEAVERAFAEREPGGLA
jgi:2-succinyl-5-enolpyruvyl-6-hydroxy-3-cyclohexene-1-carboxylate synthase